MLTYIFEFYLTGIFTEITLEVFQIPHIFDLTGKTKIVNSVASKLKKIIRS